MRIGIDVRMWNESGIGRYIRNLVRELCLSSREHEYVLFGLTTDRDAILQTCGSASVDFVKADFGWYGFKEQLYLPLLIHSARIDLMHFPHFNIPILYTGPFVVTIHDLTHFHFSMERVSTHHPYIYKVKHIAYSFSFWMAVSRSKKIITVSEYVKSEISARFKTRAEKIIVTHEGVDATFASELSSLPSKPDAHYFLYVGNAHPHKNLKLLFKAFFDFRIKHPDYRLVCVGKPNFFWNELQACAIRERLSDSVDFLGYVSDEKLKTLYAEATSFIFPSLSEGFGLPILEAMSAGCPVMCSRVSSLPEIAGSAALYFDPESLSSLTESMELIVADSTLRSRLISSGLSQVTNFSWQRMAQKTLEVYK